VGPADKRTRRRSVPGLSTSVFVGSVLLAGAAIAASASSAQVPQGSGEQPGVRDDVAGHVPDQAEQVARAPVTPSISPRSREWWSPGDGR
jgi:hypothetical protein